MQTLYKKASHLRAHTWKDIGGIGGLLLDAVFFIFLLVVSIIVTVVGFIAVAVAYLFRPLLGLLSKCQGTQKADAEEPAPALPDDGKIGVPPQ